MSTEGVKQVIGRLLTFTGILLCLPAMSQQIGDVDLHGTFSQGYLHSTENNFIEDSQDGSFEFREYGLNASYAWSEKFSLGAQIFGRDFGIVGNDDIYLDWLYGEYAWRDWMRFRAGKLTVPLGLYGETRDIDSLRTEVLLPQGVYMEYIRALLSSCWGGGVEGFVSMADKGGLSYSLLGGVASMDADNNEMSRLVSVLMSLNTSMTDMGVDHLDGGACIAGELTWHTPIEGLRLGTTLSWSEFAMRGNATFAPAPGATSYETDVPGQAVAVGSAEYVNGPLTLAAELRYGVVEGTFDFQSRRIPEVEYDMDYQGGYVKADYRFNKWLACAGGYSYFRYDQCLSGVGPGNQTFDDEQNDVFVSLRFDATDNIILKAEQHFINGTAGLLGGNPEGVEDDWHMTLLKVSYVF